MVLSGERGHFIWSLFSDRVLTVVVRFHRVVDVLHCFYVPAGVSPMEITPSQRLQLSMGSVFYDLGTDLRMVSIALLRTRIRINGNVVLVDFKYR